VQADGGLEEYVDLVFPDEGAYAPNMKLLERAKAWKMKMQAMKSGSSEGAAAASATPDAAPVETSSSSD
jgi:hypothetical protein